jgi:CRISPR-associated protein Cas1
VIIRLAQYERYLDDDFQLNQARAIVKGKLQNSRTLIRRYLFNHPEQNFTTEIELIERTLEKVERSQTINSLMGYEGIAAAAYFRCFGQMFRTELIFRERSRRPPKDPVNAILSLGYTLITNEILGMVTAHGLDPYIGFLHGVVYGRPSLALDLVEEFRQPVVDRLTLHLFNNKILSEDNFRPVEPGGVYLTPDGLKKYFQQYEQRFKGPGQVNNPDNKMNIRNIIKQQVHRMATSIQQRTIYKPYLMEL